MIINLYDYAPPGKASTIIIMTTAMRMTRILLYTLLFNMRRVECEYTNREL
jgi:hypothetical protein